jgi:hypothetical protein
MANRPQEPSPLRPSWPPETPRQYQKRCGSLGTGPLCSPDRRLTLAHNTGNSLDCSRLPASESMSVPEDLNPAKYTIAREPRAGARCCLRRPKFQMPAS